jgi:phosphotransferase system enzyme I (PtsI)
VQQELRERGIPFDDSMPVGAMVEVPAAALTAGNLLREADFVSLGTNDLTQYTLAVDRTNPLVASLFQPYHPAVLRLIKMAVDAALRAGKPVTACGEMAGSSRFAPILLGLGVTNLSMAAQRVPEVVQRIRCIRIDECEELALAMLSSDDASEAEDHLERFLERQPRRTHRRASPDDLSPSL